MRRTVLSVMIATLASASAFAAPTFGGLAQPGPATAAGQIMSTDGKPIGRVTARQGPAGVLITVEASGLTPGWHGVHIHEQGDCSDPAFRKAGSHVHDATHAVHGFLAQGGPDLGDLANLWVASDGTGRAEMFTTRVSLDGSYGRRSLIAAPGASLVIHAATDDYTSQPIGGAGARVACAVFSPAG